MKISEIVKEYIVPSEWYREHYGGDNPKTYTIRFRHCIRDKLTKYWDEDCVIGYIKDIFGAVVLFKGDRQFFSFSVKNNDVDYGGLFFSGQRIAKWDRGTMIKLFNKYGSDKKHCKILMPELYNQYKKRILVEAIENG